MTFIWKSFQDGEYLSKHTEKYILTLCKTNDFEKADFCIFVNRSQPVVLYQYSTLIIRQ